MLIVTGSATARPETIAEMTALALEHVHRSRAEPGCLACGIQPGECVAVVAQYP